MPAGTPAASLHGNADIAHSRRGSDPWVAHRLLDLVATVLSPVWGRAALVGG